MKKVFAVCLFLSIHHFASAQYVTIPDSNFRAVLKNLYPTCFNGSDQMDTTCSSIINETNLFCNGQNIASIEGVQYFKKLRNLQCGSNQLTSLPALLPTTLTSLSCLSNQLTSLPALPPNLTTFSCSSNQLTSLPALPSKLKTLSCSNNPLVSLPVLPSLLNSLFCHHDLLTSFPDLPSTLTTIDCGDNKLTALPTLPSSLGLLECSFNQLTSLPALPSSLFNLSCSYNKLSSIPSLPASLNSLGCNNNQLTTLPSLPSALTNMGCDSNQLAVLPDLPSSLTSLSCKKNNLSALPSLPVVLTVLECDSNNIASLPLLPDSLKYLSCGYNKGLSCLPELPAYFRNLYLDAATNVHCILNRPDSFAAYTYKNNIYVIATPPYNVYASLYKDYYNALPLSLCDESSGCYTSSTVVTPEFACHNSGTLIISPGISGSSFQWEVDTCGTACYQSISKWPQFYTADLHNLDINLSTVPTSFYGYKFRCLVDGHIYSDIKVLYFYDSWNGSVDNDWNNSANWDCNVVPDGNTDVYIGIGSPVVSSNVAVRSISVYNGATVTVKTGFNLTVMH